MADALVTIHSIWRWLVLAALVIAVVYGLTRRSGAAPLEKRTAQPFTLALISLDIQVLIGLVLWVAARGWELEVFQAWIHPIGMLIALGVGHAVVGRAKKSEGTTPYRTAALGILATLVLVGGTIPSDGWF